MLPQLLNYNFGYTQDYYISTQHFT